MGNIIRTDIKFSSPAYPAELAHRNCDQYRILLNQVNFHGAVWARYLRAIRHFLNVFEYYSSIAAPLLALHRMLINNGKHGAHQFSTVA